MSEALAGTGAAYDVVATATCLRDGDWIEGGLRGASAVLGAAGAWADPVAALTAAGVGWAIEHIGPLTGLLDDLAGDPAAVAADAGLLDDAARGLGAVAQDGRDATLLHLADQEGRAVTAARHFGQDAAGDAERVAFLLRAGAEAMRVASGLVEAVRSLVRDAIAELVGMATSSAIAALATAGVTAGALAVRLALRARELTIRLGDTTAALGRSFEALRVLLLRAEVALGDVARAGVRRGPVVFARSEDLARLGQAEMVARLQSVRPWGELGQPGLSGAATVVAAREE